MNTEYVKWALVVLAAYQLFVTIRILTQVQYSRFQKLAQFLVIWLVPFLGAIACELFLSADKRSPKARDTTFTPDYRDSPEI